MSVVLETERLALRHLDEDDAPFILRLVNEPSWLANIGDRDVHDIDGALRYLRDGPIAMVARYGYGLFGVVRKDDGALLGLCGILKRDALADVDLGYALLPEYWGAGYALEAARACIEWARREHGLARVVAVTTPTNAASIRLLEKLGMRYESTTRLAADAEALNLYATAWRAA